MFPPLSAKSSKYTYNNNAISSQTVIFDPSTTGSAVYPERGSARRQEYLVPTRPGGKWVGTLGFIAPYLPEETKFGKLDQIHDGSLRIRFPASSRQIKFTHK